MSFYSWIVIVSGCIYVALSFVISFFIYLYRVYFFSSLVLYLVISPWVFICFVRGFFLYVCHVRQ